MWRTGRSTRVREVLRQREGPRCAWDGGATTSLKAKTTGWRERHLRGLRSKNLVAGRRNRHMEAALPSGPRSSCILLRQLRPTSSCAILRRPTSSCVVCACRPFSWAPRPTPRRTQCTRTGSAAMQRWTRSQSTSRGCAGPMGRCSDCCSAKTPSSARSRTAARSARSGAAATTPPTSRGRSSSCLRAFTPSRSYRVQNRVREAIGYKKQKEEGHPRGHRRE